MVASLAGFLVRQLLNAYVLVWIKERTREKALWLRLIGSTAVGELADTVVFCTIAFYGVITGGEFLNYVIVGYLYKTLLEVILLPVSYPVIAAVKRHEPTTEPAYRRQRPASITAPEVIPKRHERPIDDAVADPVDQAHDEPLVVNRHQRRRQHLLGLEQMMQIRPAVVRTRVAVALVVQWLEGPSVAAAADVEPAGVVIGRGVAGDP